MARRLAMLVVTAAAFSLAACTNPTAPAGISEAPSALDAGVYAGSGS
ncbi:MAG: hypothetical protein ACRENI_06365 [Gemmatimonadaceae bacterium]